MTYISRAFFLVTFLLLGWSAVTSAPVAAQEQEVVDEIVAVVGNDIILRSDVDGFVFGLVQQRNMEYTQDLWVDALNQLINQQVLAIHAKRDTTLKVTDDQVEQALDQRIAQLTQQVGSEAKIEEIYGKSIVQIKEDLREEFRTQILADRFRSRKMSQIKVTPSEIQQWFAQFPTDSLPTLPRAVRVAHVVRYPKVSEEAEQEALDIITAIRDSVVTGTSTLEEMARRFSEDPGSATSGGAYTDMRLSELVPEFAAVASRLEPGELSQPFKTSFGYHILRINDRRGDVVDFNHILIKVDDTKADPTDTIAYLNTLRDSVLTDKVPFELIARRHSEEQFSADLGGRVVDPQTGNRDLPVQALGPTWQQTLDTLEVGEISKPAPVELLDGSRAYHIVKLQRRIPAHRVDIETDYPRIEQLALQDKRQRILDEWIAKLRDEVFIELRGKAERLTDLEPQTPDRFSTSDLNDRS